MKKTIVLVFSSIFCSSQMEQKAWAQKLKARFSDKFFLSAKEVRQHYLNWQTLCWIWLERWTLEAKYNIYNNLFAAVLWTALSFAEEFPGWWTTMKHLCNKLACQIDAILLVEWIIAGNMVMVLHWWCNRWNIAAIIVFVLVQHCLYNCIGATLLVKWYWWNIAGIIVLVQHCW